VTAVQYCDKILVMDKGAVAEFGTPRELLIPTSKGQFLGKGLFAEMVRSLNNQQKQRILSIMIN